MVLARKAFSAIWSEIQKRLGLVTREHTQALAYVYSFSSSSSPSSKRIVENQARQRESSAGIESVSWSVNCGVIQGLEINPHLHNIVMREFSQLEKSDSCQSPRLSGVRRTKELRLGLQVIHDLYLRGLGLACDMSLNCRCVS